MKLAKAARVILIGAPGVGKGTQTERLRELYPQLASIASGDLLRENVRRKTAIGQKAEKLMQTGSLVPDDMILRLIVGELMGRGWLRPQTSQRAKAIPPSKYQSGGAASDGDALDISNNSHLEVNDEPDASFVLDGFPRTAGQASQLDALVPINLVVQISTPISIILDRIANRWVHAPSGRVYNTTFNPPKVAGKDDITGEPLTRRADDSPETWERRIKTFDETSEPLLEHYDKKGALWKVEGNSSDEISPILFKEFGRRFGVKS